MHIVIFVLVLFASRVGSEFLTSPALFRSTFETEDFPEENFLKETQNFGTLTRVKNPHPDLINFSENVCKSQLPTTESSKSRAEYTTTYMKRMTLNERTLIFTFKQFYPIDFLKDLKNGFTIATQFKTHPCGRYDSPISGKDDFEEEICYDGGIFNDWACSGDCSSMWHKFRANPDCFHEEIVKPNGYWFHFVHEIYFTNTNQGYYKSWFNGVLIHEKNNIKTLYDNFPLNEDGSSQCDMYWAVGLYGHYTKLSSSAEDYNQIYIDDIGVFDPNDGVKATDLMNTTLYEEAKCNGLSNVQNACNAPFNGICGMNGKCECFNGYSGVNCDFKCLEDCINNKNSYCDDSGECQCIDGWQGVNCSVPICDSGCSINSECYAPNICKCKNGKIPPNCEEEEGECNNICGENQYCDSDGTCKCIEGFKGTECDTPICSGCLENQECSFPNTCTCKIGYLGQNCTIRDCFGNYAGDYCTSCLEGYTGDSCNELISSPIEISPFSIALIVVGILIFFALSITALVGVILIITFCIKKSKNIEEKELETFQ